MSNFPHRPWLAAFLDRSGLRTLVERYHREHEHQASALPRRNWRGFLHSMRLSPAYPALVGVLALISAGTGLYPFGPVLVAAVVIAPERWRSTYLAACVGAATGATLLALTIQFVGGHLVTEYFPGLEHSEQWTRAEQWIKAYGAVALAAIAAMPVPQMPALLILALANTHPLLIGLAIVVGKLCKYGAYALSAKVILNAIRRGLQKASPAE